VKKSYQNLIIGGCSFSSNGVGGMPPTHSNDGGCSYIDQGDGTDLPASSWAGFVAKELQVTSFVNIATEGHGNILTSTAILELLKRFNYSKDNTLILFNITDSGRYDVPCNFNHPNVSKWTSWKQDIIPYSFIARDSKIFREIEKNIGIEQIVITSANAIELLMSYLECNNINFGFLTMKNYLTSPELGPVINKRKNKFIELPNGVGMNEFCQHNSLLSDDKFHPSLEGYKVISSYVLDYVNKL
jgi:hypothetical protein